MHRNPCFAVTVIALGFLGLVGRAHGQLAGGPRLDVPLGSTVPLQMSNKQFIRGARSENPAIATVSIKVDDPRTALIKGEKSGLTRITLTDNNNNDEIYEIYVGKSNEQLRQEFLVLVRKAVPTAVVDVVPTGATTILTGTVANPETIQAIMEIARGVFAGSSIINGMTVAGVQQIQLDVVVAVVNRTEARNMGFRFLQSGQNHFIGSSVELPSNLGTAPGTTPLAFYSSLIPGVNVATTALSANQNIIWGLANNNQGFSNFLTALRTENLIKVLAEPRVTTLSGRPAYFVDGGQTPVVSSSSAGSNVTYKNFGTTVNVLPIVLGNGKIHLEVQPEISTVNNALGVTVAGISPVAAPGFDLRGARVAVQMEDGQTLVIGGLIQNRILASANKVPVLGDLPFLGFFFRSVAHREEEEELVIMVTPHLVDPLACNQLPKLLPGQETRSPDDFELFLEGILEAPRGQRTICVPGYRPAYVNAPNSGTVPDWGMPAPFGVPAPAIMNGSGTVPAFPGSPVSPPEGAPAPQLIRPSSVSSFDEIPTQFMPQPVPIRTEGIE